MGTVLGKAAPGAGATSLGALLVGTEPGTIGALTPFGVLSAGGGAVEG